MGNSFKAYSNPKSIYNNLSFGKTVLLKTLKKGDKKGAIVKSIYDEHLYTIKELLDKKVTISNISKIIGVGTRQSLNTFIKKHFKM